MELSNDYPPPFKSRLTEWAIATKAVFGIEKLITMAPLQNRLTYDEAQLHREIGRRAFFGISTTEPAALVKLAELTDAEETQRN